MKPRCSVEQEQLFEQLCLYKGTVSFTSYIAKTIPRNEDPLTPHFYIVKLGFTGVNIIFLFFALKHRLWVLVRTASMRRFNVYLRSMLCAKIRKYIFFHLKMIVFTAVKYCYILHRRVFVMISTSLRALSKLKLLLVHYHAQHLAIIIY